MEPIDRLILALAMFSAILAVVVLTWWTRLLASRTANCPSATTLRLRWSCGG